LYSQFAQARGNTLAGHQPMHAFELAAQFGRRHIEQISPDFQAARVITCISPAANRSCTAASAAALG